MKEIALQVAAGSASQKLNVLRALAQKDAAARRVTKGNWTEAVSAKAARLDWNDVVRDLLPFLEDPRESALLRPENFSLLYRI